MEIKIINSNTCDSLHIGLRELLASGNGNVNYIVKKCSRVEAGTSKAYKNITICLIGRNIVTSEQKTALYELVRSLRSENSIDVMDISSSVINIDLFRAELLFRDISYEKDVLGS